MEKILYNIKQLPFIYKHQKQPHNENSIPDFIPFTLAYCEKTGRIIQVKNSNFDSILNKIYLEGSIITGMMDDDGIGKDYADDFISLLTISLMKKEFLGLKILEIGCGTGYLLSRLKQLGAMVLGIEPGIHGQSYANKYNIEIIKDFYPSEKVQEKFDMIICNSVLEHMEDPILFLEKIKIDLKENGIVIILVQDEEPYIQNGEVSFLFHEHFSYFINKSLLNTMKIAGYQNINIKKSSFSNLLFAWAHNSKDNENILISDLSYCQDLAEDFKTKVDKVNKLLAKYINKHILRKKNIGIYCPSRCINFLIMEKIDLTNMRFFDDNKALYGTYFPGINISIENQEDLLRNPPDLIMIMSLSFAEIIMKKIRPLLPIEIEIVTINELIQL